MNPFRDNYDPNISPSKPGRVPLEARFDCRPGDRTPSPYERAKSAYWALPNAEKYVLSFWCDNALKKDRISVGWTQTAPKTGGLTVSQICDLFLGDAGWEVDAPTMAGGLLMVGKYFFPSVSSAHKEFPSWHIPVEYLGGIPAQLSSQWFELMDAV